MDQLLEYKTNWRAAITAVRKLIADPKDTPQVFVIMQSLNGKSNVAGYHRLLGTENGGQLAYKQVELAERLSNAEFLEQFEPGTVGFQYRAMMSATGYSADGLAEASQLEGSEDSTQHPYAWYTRRIRDTHDIWHVLTGYSPDEPLDEACLVAFSYAQTKGPGWALIALFAMLHSLKLPLGGMHVKAIWEAYKNGRKAGWLPVEDYLELLNEPLDQARARLNITPPEAYLRYRNAVPVSDELYSDLSWVS